MTARWSRQARVQAAHDEMAASKRRSDKAAAERARTDAREDAAAYAEAVAAGHAGSDMAGFVRARQRDRVEAGQREATSARFDREMAAIEKERRERVAASRRLG